MTIFFTGVSCESHCPRGFYGESCSKECDCKNNGSCNPQTGKCICERGWHGADCNTPCRPDKYGVNCNQDCPACVHGKNYLHGDYFDLSLYNCLSFIVFSLIKKIKILFFTVLYIDDDENTVPL